MSLRQDSKKTILKNISVVAPIESNQKDFEFHANKTLEILQKNAGKAKGEEGSEAGIQLISTEKVMLVPGILDRHEEGTVMVTLQKDGWIALPAFTDLCWDSVGLSKDSWTKMLKEKRSYGVGLTVALVSSTSVASSTSAPSSPLGKEEEDMISVISLIKDSTSDLQSYKDSSNLIRMDIQDQLYTLTNISQESSISLSSFPDTASTISERNSYYGSGNPAKQSISPWIFALMKGPQENYKHVLYDLAVYPNLFLRKSTTNRTHSNHIQLPNLMILKVDSSWDTSSLDSLLKSLFLHGGNKGQVAALYSSEGTLLHSSKEWSDILHQASMEKYYKLENDMNLAIPKNISFNGNGSRHIFHSIPESIAAFKRGEFLVVVDNEDRENEGDLIIAGQDLTPEKAAFMIRYTSGVICAPASGEILDRLSIPPMVQNNEDLYKTAYTVSIDAKMGVTTGISAADRAHTINLLSSPSSLDPALFSRPGHVFPLRARPRGVLERVGHTEASIDLCRLAGKQPVAAISEIVLDDGRMARRDDLVLFAKQHGLLICCISDLVKYVMESM